MVGIGPGNKKDRTLRAEEAIRGSTVVVGYRTYLDLISDLTEGKEVIGSGMRQEVERCRRALTEAAAGKAVALVSSGDPGIYGMAGLALEEAANESCRVPIEIIPGVSAANAAAARTGAPLTSDFACISLSDILVSWRTIRARLQAVAVSDLVVTLYNPRSRKRVKQLDEAIDIFLTHRPASTPVAVGSAIGSAEETLSVTDLAHVLQEDIGMRSIVIIGNQSSRIIDDWFVTPRGYDV